MNQILSYLGLNWKIYMTDERWQNNDKTFFKKIKQ